MNDRIILTWTISNWITVVLMVMIAGFILNAAAVTYTRIRS